MTDQMTDSIHYRQINIIGPLPPGLDKRNHLLYFISI